MPDPIPTTTPTIPLPSEADLARDLAADTATCAAASPEPWTWQGWRPPHVPAPGTDFLMGGFDPELAKEPDSSGHRMVILDSPIGDNNVVIDEDRAFIAAARTGWPAAIRRAHAAEAELVRLREELKLWRPLTPEEAQAAYDETEASPLSEEQIERIMAKALDPAYCLSNPERVALDVRVRQLEKERDRLAARLLTAAGDDLCRLTQDEIKALGAGTVKIPPRDEFLASCARFHEQLAAESGVMTNCLTLAQLVAENQQQAHRIAALEAALRSIHDLADDELRRLGAVPGSNAPQIEANARDALEARPT